MAVYIRNITITPNETTVGQPVFISVTAESIEWSLLRDNFANWGEVRRSFEDWDAVRKYIYSIPNPTADSDALLDSNGKAIFDVDAVQISVSGGAQLTHTADEVEQFVREVNNA